jgi:hypothetical protein
MRGAEFKIVLQEEKAKNDKKEMNPKFKIQNP